MIRESKKDGIAEFSSAEKNEAFWREEAELLAKQRQISEKRQAHQQEAEAQRSAAEHTQNQKRMAERQAIAETRVERVAARKAENTLILESFDTALRTELADTMQTLVARAYPDKDIALKDLQREEAFSKAPATTKYSSYSMRLEHREAEKTTQWRDSSGHLVAERVRAKVM